MEGEKEKTERRIREFFVETRKIEQKIENYRSKGLKSLQALADVSRQLLELKTKYEHNYHSKEKWSFGSENNNSDNNNDNNSKSTNKSVNFETKLLNSLATNFCDFQNIVNSLRTLHSTFMQSTNSLRAFLSAQLNALVECPALMNTTTSPHYSIIAEEMETSMRYDVFTKLQILHEVNKIVKYYFTSSYFLSFLDGDGDIFNYANNEDEYAPSCDHDILDTARCEDKWNDEYDEKEDIEWEILIASWAEPILLTSMNTSFYKRLNLLPPSSSFLQY